MKIKFYLLTVLLPLLFSCIMKKIMSLKKITFLIIYLISGSQLSFAQSETSNLPVVDLAKNYSEEKLRLQDFATAEYVPIETTDEILLSEHANLSAVTDNYFLIYEFQLGDVYLFDRHTGKLRHHFNNKGQGGMEYSWINVGVILDEKNKEIFVCAQHFQVYDFDGKYKRTLKGINGFDHDMKVFDYNNEYLLVFDDVIIQPSRKNKTSDKPYRLISKKDGSTVSKLNISFSKRVSKSVAQPMDNNMWKSFKFSYPYNICNGKDFMIMDISSDTLYHLSPSNGLLKPVFTRTPSVFASEPRNIWTPYLSTDNFMLFGTFVLDFKKGGGRLPTFMYDYNSRKLKKVKLLDMELNYGFNGPREWDMPVSNPAIEKNMVAELITAPTMIEAYKKKHLLGNGNDVAKKLAEDDNQVVRILKFK